MTTTEMEASAALLAFLLLVVALIVVDRRQVLAWKRNQPGPDVGPAILEPDRITAIDNALAQTKDPDEVDALLDMRNRAKEAV